MRLCSRKAHSNCHCHRQKPHLYWTTELYNPTENKNPLPQKGSLQHIHCDTSQLILLKACYSHCCSLCEQSPSVLLMTIPSSYRNLLGNAKTYLTNSMVNNS